MKKKIIIIVSVSLALVLTGMKLLNNQKTVQDKVYHPDPEKKVLVKTQAVKPKNLDKTFTYTGTFRPFREIMLIPQYQGEVTNVFFDEGDVVPKGKQLLQIDDEMLRAQYISVQATYENAKRNFERYEKASASEGISKMQYDNYLQQYKHAESQLKQLEKSIRLARLSAPFTGTITLRNVEIGTVIGNNTNIGRLTDLTQLKLEIAVPESEISLFQEGEQIAIKTDVYPTQELIGNIDYVADRSDDSHNYTVKVLLQNNQDTELKAGMYGKAIVNKDLQENTLVISRSALLGSAKNPQVYVINDDSTVSLRKILIGSSNSLEIEVIDGLREGDQVVVSGQINIADGSRVKIAKN